MLMKLDVSVLIAKFGHGRKIAVVCNFLFVPTVIIFIVISWSALINHPKSSVSV